MTKKRKDTPTRGRYQSPLTQGITADVWRLHGADTDTDPQRPMRASARRTLVLEAVREAPHGWHLHDLWKHYGEEYDEVGPRTIERDLSTFRQTRALLFGWQESSPWVWHREHEANAKKVGLTESAARVVDFAEQVLEYGKRNDGRAPLAEWFVAHHAKRWNRSGKSAERDMADARKCGMVELRGQFLHPGEWLE